jgi:hypothetical protein
MLEISLSLPDIILFILSLAIFSFAFTVSMFYIFDSFGYYYDADFELMH